MATPSTINNGLSTKDIRSRFIALVLIKLSSGHLNCEPNAAENLRLVNLPWPTEVLSTCVKTPPNVKEFGFYPPTKVL